MLMISDFTYSQVSWSVNSADYSLDAAVIASLTINGTLSTDTNDVVAAFDSSGEIRGVSKVTFSAPLNKYLVFLTVLSNTNGDKLTFKIYDASEDQVYEATDEGIVFEPNKIYGSNETPIQIKYDSQLSVSENTIVGFTLYPNPVINNIKITAKEKLDALKIYSLLGREISTKKINATSCNVNFERFSSGIYIVKVFSNTRVISRKIIKK